MKKIVLVILSLQTLSNINCIASPASDQPSLTLTIKANTHNTRGLIGDLHDTLQETQHAITNFPQTLSSMLPSVNNLQKLLLCGSIIGLGYTCCKYGIAKLKTASKLYCKRDKPTKGQKNYDSCKSHAFFGSCFFFTGSCMLLFAQRIANLVY